MTPYLSLAIWVPIVAGLAVLGVSRDRDASIARWIALAGALAGFVVTLPLYFHFDAAASGMQFVERVEWIPRFDIWYLLGVDGMDQDLAMTLASRGILTREDLAEQAVDDLLEIDGVDAERAGALIMAARKHWFDAASGQ